MLILTVAMASIAQTQRVEEQAGTLTQLPKKYLDEVGSKAQKLEQGLDKKTEKALAKLEKEEAKLKAKLQRLDSTKAAQLFGDVKGRYQNLRTGLQNKTEKLKGYIPSLDTLSTSLSFLKDNSGLLGKIKDGNSKLTAASGKLDGLRSSFSASEKVREFLQERKRQLTGGLRGTALSGRMGKWNKQAYYYSQQVQEYKALLKDHQRATQKAVEVLSRTKPFQEFMRRNSELAQLFRLPGAGGVGMPGGGTAATNAVSLQGLQTRASVQNLLQQRFGNNVTVASLTQQATGGAGSGGAGMPSLSGVQSRLQSLQTGAFGNTDSDIDMPDGFKPNGQKTKSFLKRLEVGTNVQTQRARYMFPVTSDLALSLGYKLNDKSVVGIGAAYKMGLGRGWDNMRITHQGVGLRSYVDWKLKGAIYITGGYEQNYLSEFRRVDQLKNYSAWQTSGLIGLSKRYQAGKKLKGEIKLLWDFLSYQQVPRTQAVLVRMGYRLK